MNEFDELTEEDRVKVIAGFAMVAVVLVATYVFGQFLVLEDRLHVSSLWTSGLSIFSIVRTIMPVMYAVFFLPASIVAGAASAWLKKQFSALLSIPFLLLGAGGYFLIAALLLTLFDVCLAGLPMTAQTFLMALAFFIPAVIVARVLKIQRVDSLVKRAFR